MESSDLQICEEESKNLYLVEIEKLLHTNIRSLKNLKSMSIPNMSIGDDLENKFIADQLK